jgi:hypothetical protein
MPSVSMAEVAKVAGRKQELCVKRYSSKYTVQAVCETVLSITQHAALNSARTHV